MQLTTFVCDSCGTTVTRATYPQGWLHFRGHHNVGNTDTCDGCRTCITLLRDREGHCVTGRCGHDGRAHRPLPDGTHGCTKCACKQFETYEEPPP